MKWTANGSSKATLVFFSSVINYRYLYLYLENGEWWNRSWISNSISSRNTTFLRSNVWRRTFCIMGWLKPIAGPKELRNSLNTDSSAYAGYY